MGDFSEATKADICLVARERGIEPAALLAVCEVESAGRAFAIVGGRREPIIRFEGHYFDRLLSSGARRRARSLGLANPKAGVVKNPLSQSARWDMLRRARAIDDAAALQSCSWGIGQVMGSHWKALGYASPLALVEEARADVAGQVRLMARFIEKNGLMRFIENRDWVGFAYRYNGPAYRKNRYDEKMASAYARHASGKASPKKPVRRTNCLRRGSRGETVRDMQRMLVAAGYPLICDAVFGPKTETALKRFQTNRGLLVDGIYGPQSAKALQSLLAQRGARGRWIGRWIKRIEVWMPVFRLVARLLRWTR